ncbi:MAG: hypothetical protein JOY64_20750 [Alphaproteobacteria bacterium]|nr:hypothetical protein [Alphaproteobacteria bacterium]MBV8410070.1 hypothetical protein [Alphaproteobacteria bacterium]
MAALSRRRLFGVGLGAAALAAMPALASDGKGYEANLMNCIDPRFTTFLWKYMGSRGWQDQYSQFVVAGGPIGVVAPAFAKWQDTYWDNLAITVQLHSIKRVVGVVHRDCGAAAVAYGDRIKTDKAYETAMSTEALHQFRDGVKKRQPQLVVDLGIMDLTGAVEPVS